MLPASDKDNMAVDAGRSTVQQRAEMENAKMKEEKHTPFPSARCARPVRTPSAADRYSILPHLSRFKFFARDHHHHGRLDVMCAASERKDDGSECFMF